MDADTYSNTLLTQPGPMPQRIIALKFLVGLIIATVFIPAAAYAVPPNAPTIDPPVAAVSTDPRPTITGSAEASSTVELFDGATSLGTTVATVGGTFSFTPSSNFSDGTHHLTATATNVDGTSSQSAVQDFGFDTTPPTVVISSTATSPTRFSPIPITFQFSEDVTSFAIGDVVVTNGTKGNFVAVDPNTYTMDVTPTANGAVSVAVAGAVCQDIPGNANTAATTFNITYDTVTQAPTLTIPASSSTFSTSMGVSYTLPEAVLTNSVHLKFFNQSAVLVEDLTLSSVTSATFTFNTKSVSAGANILTFTASSIPDGLYTVALSYQDAAGNNAASAFATNVAVDTVTQSPTLTAPASSSSVTSPIAVNINLPETPSAASLTFVNNASSAATVLTLSAVGGARSFTFDPSNIAVDTNITARTATSIPDGVYTVTLAYRDALSNPFATAISTNVTIDTTTLSPTLTAPASGATVTNPVGVSITIPETASAASLTFINNANSASTVLTLSTASGARTFAFDPANIPINSNILARTATSIPDGTYSVILSYKDVLNNPAASATSTNVKVDTVTQTPSLTAPTAGTVAALALPIAYTLPESPNPGTVNVSFVDAANAIAEVLTLSDLTSGSFTINPQSVVTNTNVVARTAARIPDGTYSVRLSYSDAYGNPASTSSVTPITINSQLDSDGDGVPDSQEVTDGTNPNDPGSFEPVLPLTWCSEWNGFLGMYNINEYVNLDGSNHDVTATIYDAAGASQSAVSVHVLAGAQTDLLVHGMTGWAHDAYGKVCSTVDAPASAGDIDGRMVYYKQSGSGYQFAFAMPFESGYAGDQFTTFNTYQPSLDPSDAKNLAANWIQITNLESTTQTGALEYYSQAGDLIATDPVSLPGSARQDFSGHRFGSNLVGIIRWAPTSGSARFLMRNVRYYYDNEGAISSFASAMQLEGVKGSGELLSVPLDTSGKTAVLEVANVTASAITAAVAFYDSTGTNVSNQTLSLPAYGSVHLIADSIFNGGLGMATVDGSGTGSVIAVGMHYGRTSSHGIQYVYGIIAKQAVGAVLRGSYNTYLGQGCELLLTNPTASAVNSTVSLVRYDGTNVLSGDAVSTAAHGVSRYNLCSHESPDFYGVVTVQPGTANSIFPTVVRTGANDDYRFPTAVK
ncbi:MAG: Ig-like domain-containing protein [Bdellovibrionota bacterium]